MASEAVGLLRCIFDGFVWLLGLRDCAILDHKSPVLDCHHPVIFVEIKRHEHLYPRHPSLCREPC